MRNPQCQAGSYPFGYDPGMPPCGVTVGFVPQDRIPDTMIPASSLP